MVLLLWAWMKGCVYPRCVLALTSGSLAFFRTLAHLSYVAYNTLLHTATHCNTLHRASKYFFAFFRTFAQLICMSLDSFIYDMTHSHVTWLLHMFHDSFQCGMTHPRVTWLNRMRHDSFVYDTTHSYVAWCVIADKGHPRASFCTSLDGTHCNTLHRTSTHFLAFFRTLVHLYVSYVAWRFIAYEGHPRVSFCTSLDATHCNTQHRTTTNCIALQHIASHTSQCWSVTSSVLLMMSAFFIFFRTWRIRMWHDSFVRDMIYSYVAWFIHMCHDSFICDMTHSCMTWLI